MTELDSLVKEFTFSKKHIENLLSLYLDGNTVPFIARYRKEQTGAMDEIQIRAVLERYEYLENLNKRREEILKNIDEKGKLTDDLKKSILKAQTLTELEDIYAPYKSKKKTKADIAREAGVEPVAEYIKSNTNIANLEDFAKDYTNENTKDIDTVLSMARDIITEDIGHNINIKNRLREIYNKTAVISTIQAEDFEERTPYEAYYEFEEKVSTLPPHRILAIFRGERENILKVKLIIDEESCINTCLAMLYEEGYKHNKVIEKCASRAFKTMLSSSIELEIRGELRQNAEERAIHVFGDNLKSLLMTPPVKGRSMLGLDPAYRTGCKYAAVDETGKLLTYGVIYPTPPQNDYEGSKKKVIEIINKFKINAISIGNGTASRETEEFVAKVLSETSLSVEYTIVNEAGASVYSASEVAAKEFPDLDVTIRGAISIARRVIDPLAELVKIEPRSIGVGMYQHDVNKKKLENTLQAVVEDVVNNVGVNLNTASPSLLQYVSGLNYNIAEKIVKYREDNGIFSNRNQLLKITGLGDATFKQCAGFLKIYGGDEPLDSMFIHPETYDAVHMLLNKLNLTIDKLSMIRLAVKGNSINKLSEETGLGTYTFNDIIENLEKPDRDIRDSVDPVIFKKSVMNLDDLKPSMIITGKVTNIVDFGAFVDIGLKNDGLVHISELSENFIKHPSEVVKVGQKVQVMVVDIDKERGRISLSMRI